MRTDPTSARSDYVSLVTFTRKNVGRNGVWLVGRVHPGGPADRAGLRSGDVVTAVDGVSVQALEEYSALAGLINHATYAISILRAGVGSTRLVEAKRYADIVAAACHLKKSTPRLK
ncbi:MAG: PDZ domain-containing protein [Candidatus Eremiobacteraeota bacterium]|nr:PDZ domain-containing protein [Candidatus Eremiobacteraeota bacterium]